VLAQRPLRHQRLSHRNLVGNLGKSYNPNTGFIGKVQVDVANYLFSKQFGRSGYPHSKNIVAMILGKGPEVLHKESSDLTEFLRRRDMTFQKTGKDGVYRIFTVPVTTTVVPLPKTIFNDVERAAQILVFSLRKVLQSIYGSESVADSKFVQSLPSAVRKVFLAATIRSPHYLPQLHHPCMRDYPFFDNVGLDLVLVDEYFRRRGEIGQILEDGRADELPELPFKILELNAGSPSGASNNATILEGISRQDSSMLESIGNVLPNDHFACLRETYRSLGEGWTGISDAVQVLLPPGGSNGASPEIHQLAAFSGLIYCDAGQLYKDPEGYVRLRTISGNNPRVNSIYSRVNSDSALYDPEKNLFLRDSETGAPVYVVDTLKPWKKGRPEYIKDETGHPVPLESSYFVPGAVDAILSRKLYMGGLNRLLDNKIILAALTEYAPKFFEKELAESSLFLQGPRIDPPQCLPSHPDSIATIEKRPSDWVIKSPNLSGGTGVNILVALEPEKRRIAIRKAKKNPEDFAYQKVVRIGRIPVAVRSSGKKGFRFANLAADIRMWVFYGGRVGERPKLTHNALVRYAPEEKGPMSSIVNTSKGGGYAPFVVVDDVGLPQALPATDLAKPLEPAQYSSDLPIFVAAQFDQVARFVARIRFVLQQEEPSAFEISGLVYGLKDQCREIASFLHPHCMEPMHSLIDLLEKRTPRKEISDYFLKSQVLRARLVDVLAQMEKYIEPEFFTVLDELLALDDDIINRGYNAEDRRLDWFTFGHLSFLLNQLAKKEPEHRKLTQRCRSVLKEIITQKFPACVLPPLLVKRLTSIIDQFLNMITKRIERAGRSTEFARVIANASAEHQSFHERMIHQPNPDTFCATEWEFATGQSFIDAKRISPRVWEIRDAWISDRTTIEALPVAERAGATQDARARHFARFPELREIQALIQKETNRDPNAILKILPFLPYAHEMVRSLKCDKPESVFSPSLESNHVAILNRDERRALKLTNSHGAGECFAKKKEAHGLLSNANIYCWIAEECSPLVQAYTLGHELIHRQQITELLEMEKNAIAKGSEAHAEFLSWYAAFFSFAPGAVESIEHVVARVRRPLFGLADRIVPLFNTAIMKTIRKALVLNGAHWEHLLKSFGSLLSYMMPKGPGIQVKALREVIPAYENAKNLRFLEECGLITSIDWVASALPAANVRQLKRYKPILEQAIHEASPNFEALRLIASHQYYGVRFARKQDRTKSLSIEVEPCTIYPVQGYNQTQQ